MAATPKPERDASLARLASGEIELVTNCLVLTEGWDMPEVGCCILARPTRKMGLYRQMIGRVLRPAPEKPTRSCSIIPAPCFAMALSKITSSGRSILIAAPAVASTHGAATAETSRLIECTQCGAIRVAGEPAHIVDFSRDAGHATWLQPPASSAWLTVTATSKPTSVILWCGIGGTRCSLTSHWSETTNPAG